jgi:hypothetical protein
MAKTGSGSKKSSKSSRKGGRQGAKSKKVPPPIRLSPDHDFRSQWKVCENACLTHEDAAEFSQALCAAFPRLRFLSQDHWKPFVDWDAWHAEIEAWRRRDPKGLESEPIRHRMRDPAGLALQYWDHLGVAEESAFDGWIIPDGWKPEWGETDKYGIRRIVNPPRLALFFRRGQFHCPDRRPLREAVRFRDPPEPRGDEETLELEGSQLNIRYNRYDEAAAAFAKAVFRILYKHVVDRFITIESKSRRALTPVPERNRRFGVAGRRAEAWALKRRHNYLLVPNSVKPVSYPFAPGDVMSAEEHAALEARWAAELEEAVAREKRKHKELAEKWRREAGGH